jgi:hypothetical protein
MKSKLFAKGKSWRNRAESGFTTTVQAIYYTVLLFLFFAYIFDFGGAGYIATVGTEAARLAAQDAAKNIDRQAFLDNQEIRLSPDAKARAEELVGSATAGSVAVVDVRVNSQATRDVIAVYATARADMPILGSLIGLGPITFPIEAFAEPAYGINEPGQ